MSTKIIYIYKNKTTKSKFNILESTAELCKLWIIISYFKYERKINICYNAAIIRTKVLSAKNLQKEKTDLIKIIKSVLYNGVPERIRTSGLPLRRSPRGAFLTPCKSPKILDFTGVSGVSLLVNSRPKPANFSWFFAFLLAGY